MSIKLKGGTLQLQYRLPIAGKGKDGELGGIKIGEDFTIDSDGVLTLVMKGVQAAYVKGTTPFANDWLADGDGNIIIPENGGIYVVMTEGDYQYKMFVYDNGYHSITGEVPGGGGGGSGSTDDDAEAIPLDDLAKLFNP